MQRNFLENFGLDKDTVDKIMEENGRDIERIKGERDSLRSQLQTAQTTLKSFEGINVTELQGKVSQLENDLATKDADYQRQLADRDFNDLLKATAATFNPRDIKAVMPFLDVDKLKASKNQEADIKAAMETVKKENAYLFQDINIPKFVSSTPGPSNEPTDTRTRANEALRSILGRE